MKFQIEDQTVTVRSAPFAPGACELDGCGKPATLTFRHLSPYPDANGDHGRKSVVCSEAHAVALAESLWGIGHDLI